MMSPISLFYCSTACLIIFLLRFVKNQILAITVSDAIDNYKNKNKYLITDDVQTSFSD